MIERLIAWCVHNRVLVLLVTATLAAAGAWAMWTTPVDAVPDLSDVQVIVYTDHPGQGPEVVEEQVTYPLTSSLLAVPHAETVRGYSFFGLSMVYVIFEDGTDLYWARSRVLEALAIGRDRLPSGVSPRLGPDATGVGWVFMYTLSDFGPRATALRARHDVDGNGLVEAAELPAPTGKPIRENGFAIFTDDQLADVFGPPPRQIFSDPNNAAARRWTEDSIRFLKRGFDTDGDGGISFPELERAVAFQGIDLAELRSIQDWYLRYELTAVPGVSEVASVGGHVRQFQVEVDPERLRAFSLPLGAVRDAIRRSNVDVGGRLLEMGETEFMVRSRGTIRSLEDLRDIPVGFDLKTHTPILLHQVGRVQAGPELRRGLVDMDGLGEAVTGIVIQRHGENARAVIERVRRRLDEIAPGLPEGVELHVSYDRGSLIERAINVLGMKIAEELIVVALICLLFLGHLRSALVTAFTLPVGILVAFLGMKGLGLNANIMSLGGIAIAIGVMVDAAVVLVENVHKRKEHKPNESQTELVIRAAGEVGPALFFSLLVVMVSFFPVFALQAEEGRLFRPLAFTKTFAMGAGSLLAVTVIPALLYYCVRGNLVAEARNPMTRMLRAGYEPVLRRVLRAPRATLLVLVLAGFTALWPVSRLGSEFMPPLNEGDILYMPTTPPGLSITKARELLQQTDRVIASHPQVAHVLGKAGRANTATDPAPLSMLETTILLTDETTWPKGKAIEDVIAELDAMVQFPGLTNAWTMPIKARLDMLATGIKTPVGIKLLGDDLSVLSEVGTKIETVVRRLPGTSSVYSERVVGGKFVDIDIRRDDAARHGLTVGAVQEVVRTAIGGTNITWALDGLERTPVNLRFPRELRDDLDALGAAPIHTPGGYTVPLRAVADISLATGPPMIKSENARRTAWIFVDLDTTDIGGYIDAAKAAVHEAVDLPRGVSLAWSGQYEAMERANRRLSAIVPLTLAIIVLLLYLHFGNLPETLIVVGTLPFALVGGIWLLWALEFNMSVATGVGFIALAGLAAETGVLMLVYLDEAWRRWQSEGRLRTLEDLRRATLEGSVGRARPKIMTVATTIFGLMPIMLGAETGTRIMKRIAAPMVGGMLTSTLLTLVLVPVVWFLWRARSLQPDERT